MSRSSAFLSRVAEAVHAGNRYRETPRHESDSRVGYLGAGSDPVRRLEEELRSVGCQPHRVDSCADGQVWVRQLLERYSIRRAIRSSGTALDEMAVDAVLRGAGVELATPSDLAALDEPERRDCLFAAELGLAAPDWAIAETGTLVYVSGPEQTRSATLLPPVHLAILDSRYILPDLFDLSAKLGEQAIRGMVAGNVTLITGPSKTGDIELRLTTGVHGPGEVHVLVWERH